MGGKKVYELMLEIGYKSQPLKAVLPNGYTHKWTVYVRGADNSRIEHCIDRVVFQLHESFPDHYRDWLITNKSTSYHHNNAHLYNEPVEVTEPPFQVKETGYAGFVIPISVYFKRCEKPSAVDFSLDLILLTDKPNSLSRVHKLKFSCPHRDFEKCLIKSGAQLLPVTKDKKERSDSPPAKKQKSYSLIPSKDMSKQAQSNSQSDNNHSHSSSASLTSHNQVPPSSQTNQQQHHHKSKSSQLNLNHHSGYNNHSHSNNDLNGFGHHNSSSSNSLFGNHTSHHSNHQNNHQMTKPSSQQQSVVPKPKTSSKEMCDIFGVPLVYNNNKSQKTSNGKDHSLDSRRDVTPATTNNRSPIPPVTRQPSPQVSTAQSQSHSHSHHNKPSHKHDKHHKHHKHNKHHHRQIKQEPVETLKTPPPPPPPAQIQNSQKASQKKPPPPQHHQQQAQAFVAQADPFQILQSKISSMTDTDRLQKIVDIIEESGEWFNLTPNKFEFDLKRLDKKTLSRIEKCLP